MMCIDCEKEFEPPKNMPYANMCEECWSKDVDRAFPMKVWSKEDMLICLAMGIIIFLLFLEHLGKK